MANKDRREFDPLISILEAIKRSTEKKLKDQETSEELSKEKPVHEFNKYIDLIGHIEFLLHELEITENNFELAMCSLDAVSNWLIV